MVYNNSISHFKIIEKKRDGAKARISAWDGSIVEEPKQSPQASRKSASTSANSSAKKWHGNYGTCAMDNL